ncbi:MULTISPECIES: ATP-binding cassette domain-containing protein [unclassified Clostridioides]|uniref:ATP-binding cassette domain-containing protein n=1 Tax=unclassified Clostridioides TaxID=2635829 RepID=UPI001D0C00DB|nr:ATP-binding cassette domain-containing protein [Clostridioides sp. ES-S-0048-02]MCC0762467.1 ATP-binding cassette domain-containing protein [Clostridioides sp. ES-S-0006-03]
MKSITIYPGKNKLGNTENFESLTFYRGHIYSIVGNTGSGKSRLIKDIDQFVNKDSLTNRKVVIDNMEVAIEERNKFSTNLISHLSQNMRFVLDSTVEEFLVIHKECKNNTSVSIKEVLDVANSITAEPISLSQDLTSLSGGQTRALMIADVALISNNPIVLIDEIENAGINKNVALDILLKSDKLIFIVTHDPHTALIAEKRIIMKNGSIFKVINKTNEEKEILGKLKDIYEFQLECQYKLRKGETLHEKC